MTGTARPALLVVGEPMVELVREADGRLLPGFGGDALNVAVHAARSAAGSVDVQFASAVGRDPWSDRLLRLTGDEGVGTAAVSRLPGSPLGLYLVDADARGERTFTYYRSAAPVRTVRPGSRALRRWVDRMRRSDLIHLSGITLSVLQEPTRRVVLEALTQARRTGARVSFDPNFRAAGWPGRAAARRWIDRALERSDIALPSLDDELSLRGARTVEEIRAHHRSRGVEEIVVTIGRHGSVVAAAGDPGLEVSAVRVDAAEVRDTTAAGDAFAGCYLVHRLQGADPRGAALAASDRAARVIRHQGALGPIRWADAGEGRTKEQP